MDGAWRKAWEFESRHWTDVWAGELYLREAAPKPVSDDAWDDLEAREAMWTAVHAPGTLRTSGDPVFIARCAPGRWRLDVYEYRPEPGWRDVIEARLRRSGRRLVEWDWQAIEKRRFDRKTGARLYGVGSLNGGTYSFWREAEVRAWLDRYPTTREANFRGLFEDSVGRRYNSGRRRFSPFFEGAGVTLLAPGDVPYATALVHHAWDDIELGWSLTA